MSVLKNKLVTMAPMLICAVLSVVLLRTGFLTPLYLIPIGYLGYRLTNQSVWLGVLLSTLLNALVAFILAGLNKNTSFTILLDIVYFSMTLSVFAWLVAPPRFGSTVLRIKTIYRLSIASVLASLSLWPILAFALGDENFYSFIKQQMELISQIYTQSSGSDVVQQSIIEKYVTPDALIETIAYVSVRGGVIVSHWLFFAFSLYLSRHFSSLFGGPSYQGHIKSFTLDGNLIWVLSVSIAVVLGGLLVAWNILEILGWNLMLLCLLAYGLQGLGIIFHFLDRPNIPRGLRVMMKLFLILTVLSPGINAVAIGFILILGIAETWLPLRAPHKNG